MMIHGTLRMLKLSLIGSGKAGVANTFVLIALSPQKFEAVATKKCAPGLMLMATERLVPTTFVRQFQFVNGVSKLVVS